MAKAEQTLYEKLRSEVEHEEQKHPAGIRFSMPVKVAIITLTLLSCSLFFPGQPELTQAITIGSEWAGKTIVAQYPFPINKPQEQYKREVQEAIENTPLYFTENTSALQKIEKRFAEYTEILLENEEFSIDTVSVLTMLSKENLRTLRAMSLPRRRVFLQELVTSLLAFQRRVYQMGFINISHTSLKTPEIIVRLTTTTEKLLSKNSVLDSTAYKQRMQILFKENFSEAETAIASELAGKMLLPNLLYSEELTTMARQLPAQTIPQTLGIVKAGETIVTKGERITERTVLKIQSYEYTRLLQNENRHPLLPFLGNIAHTSLLLSLMMLFFYFIRKRIFDDNWQMAGICFAFVVVALFAWLSMRITSEFPFELLIVLPTMSMLIAIIFDSRTAFYTTVTMVFLIAGVRANDYETAFTLLIGSAFANYTVRDLRSRTQMFKSIGSALMGYTIAIIGLGLQHSTAMQEVGEQLAFASVNAVISPLLTFGLLFIIERVFNITSDLRLLEYDNMNHPLLLELNEKAPGTYQHTLTIARLAESAARAIEANPILAKAGSYFHDIGKIAKAEYFVENQLNIGNKHDRLSPLKSAAIIRNHVADGVELGQEYGLPQRILDFIPMHHGTMLIKYFYVKALEESRVKNTIVNEEDFRYPGPKPKSKETAIVMLADAVEALSRTLDSSTTEELEQAIDSIIRDRLLDNQFDECDLTLRELELIKQAFIRNLRGMRHQRIKYKNIPSDMQPDAAQQDNSKTRKKA